SATLETRARNRTGSVSSPPSSHARITSTAVRSGGPVIGVDRPTPPSHGRLRGRHIRHQFLHLKRRLDAEVLFEEMPAEAVLADRLASVSLRQMNSNDRSMRALAQRLARECGETRLEGVAQPARLRQ